VPTLLFLPIVEAADSALRQAKADGRLADSKVDVANLFRRFGAVEWDALRERFNAGASATASAEKEA
jgi:hypothetical protein